MFDKKKHSVSSIIFCLIFVSIIAFIASSTYRGIFSDDSRDYMYRADVLYFEGRMNTEYEQAASSFLYPALIALAYRLVGHTLLASHLFPFLFAVAIPPFLFLLLQKILRHNGWACLGTLLYIAYPTNIVWLNQNLTEPVFTFWLVVTLLLFELTSERPALLIAVGAASAFLVMTRLFDGLLFTGIMFISIFYRDRFRVSWKWLALASLTFIGLQFIAGAIFDFSLSAYLNYFYHIATVNTQSNSAVNPPQETLLASKTFLRWYFAETWAFVSIILLLCGIWQAIRKHAIQFPLYFILYSIFLLTVYGKRGEETLLLRHASPTILALIVLLILGWKFLYEKINDSKYFHKSQLFSACFLLALLLFWGKITVDANLRFIQLMADIIPSSSLWQIIRTNPIYPQYGKDTLMIREDMFKKVLGNYRPSYRSRLAQNDWKENLPMKEREYADFAYHDTFDNEAQWKAEAFEISGTSALWTAKHPGQLGAFPYQAEGTVVYKFSFPREIERIALGDIHNQWAPGDIVRMWISSNGQQWMLQYDDNLRYQKSYFYRVLTKEDIPRTQTLYVKYYFYAGDATRKATDNRGASLEEFSLAITLRNE